MVRKSKITKLLTERNDNEVYIDEVKKILTAKKYDVTMWKAKEATIDGERTFIRAGSDKSKGWQITFRGSTSKPPLEKGIGFLLVPRGPILLLPLKEIKDTILSVDTTAFERESVDVFFRFDDDKIVLVYKTAEKDVSSHALLPYPPL